MQAIRALTAFALVVAGVSSVAAADIQGDYLESRTCDVYTGPCFANGEVGLAGKEAIMAWNIEQGQLDGVDVAGLKVVVALSASDTLAYGGGMTVRPEPIRSVVLIDAAADTAQHNALLTFVKQKAGHVMGDVSRVARVPIDMQLDHVAMVARLKAGDEVHLLTRKINDGDKCCTNEEIYYPPLSRVENSAPAFTLESGFRGRGLGLQWSGGWSRSSFLATFAH